jgi:hypothetical protein
MERDWSRKERRIDIDQELLVATVDIRQGDDWKIRLLTHNVTPAPAK